MHSVSPPGYEGCPCTSIVVARSHARRLLHAAAITFVVAVAVLVALGTTAFAQDASPDADAAAACGPTAACPVDELPLPAPAADAATPSTAVLMFFWGVGCPHCEEAKPFVDALERDEPRLRTERIEVRQDPEGRRRFLETMKRLGASAAGVPTFVVGDAYVVGYVKGETEREVIALVRRALRPNEATAAEPTSPRKLNVPLIGDGRSCVGFATCAHAHHGARRWSEPLRDVGADRPSRNPPPREEEESDAPLRGRLRHDVGRRLLRLHDGLGGALPARRLLACRDDDPRRRAAGHGAHQPEGDRLVQEGAIARHPRQGQARPLSADARDRRRRERPGGSRRHPRRWRSS